MGEPDSSAVRTIAASPALAERRGNRLDRRIVALKHYWLYSRLLVTAGALLVALAAWMPWVSVRVFDVARADYLSTPLLLDPGDLSTDHYGGLFWAILTVFGLLLVPFLWRRPRPGGRVPIAPVVYVGWVAVLLVLGGMASSAILQPGAISLVPELHPSPIAIDQQQFLPGVWLGGAGALIALLATFALVRNLARRPAAAQPPVASARTVSRRRPAIGALVFAVLFWGAGTLVLPWSTVNCTANPLFFGQCTGLPFSGVLSDAMRVDVPSLDPLAALYGVNVLLSGGALLVLLAVFGGVRSRTFAFWTTIWLLLATGFCALASVGVRLVASSPAQFGLSGTWNGDMGIFVTLLAIALGWLGTGALWLGGQRPAPA